MARHTRLVREDLDHKHAQMTASVFYFFRATFYRWMQVWKETVGEVAAAPHLLAVGDLHVENFGTWRDCEGRLIWGVNDFDEVYTLPYTLDLVRLAASAHLAIADEHLMVSRRDACSAIFEGYRDAFKKGGRPFVLAERHRWLRKMALNRLRDPRLFWEKIQALPDFKGEISREVLRKLEELMPARGLSQEKKHRVAGLGSLGHERLVIVAEWRGGLLAREAKALVPSACFWAGSHAKIEKIRYGSILDCAVRVPDPFLHPYGDWLLRRLAPDCSRIELASLPAKRDEQRLLYSMGWETANIHLGSKEEIPKVLADLKKRKGDWLHLAAREMVRAVERDWKAWRRG
ncbi:MAG: DUF2252 family protein [Candidatus Acidiferrales bacterium]